MANIRKREDRYNVTVRVKGCAPVYRSFDKLYDAQQWANETEARLRRGGMTDIRMLSRTTVGNVMETYRDTVSAKKKGWRNEMARLDHFLSLPWAQLNLDQDIAAALRQWRDARLSEVKPQSIVRDFNLLSAMFKHAMTEMGLPLLANPVALVKRPKVVGGVRDVTWTQNQLTLFLDHLGWDYDQAPTNSRQKLAWLILLARLSGARKGELCSLEVNKRVIDPVEGLMCPHFDPEIPGVYLPDTKNGSAHIYPLNIKAADAFRQLAKLQAGKDKLLGISPGVATAIMGQERAALVEQGHDVAHLRIHDQRHTWTSEMVPVIARRGGSLADMLKVTGRKSTASLMRYYNPKASELAKLLD